MKSQNEATTAIARRYDYGDHAAVVADFGPDEGDISVDVVGDTALVVVERDGDSETRELSLPEGAAQAYINNGVVSIEVER